MYLYLRQMSPEAQKRTYQAFFSAYTIAEKRGNRITQVAYREKLVTLRTAWGVHIEQSAEWEAEWLAQHAAIDALLQRFETNATMH